MYIYRSSTSTSTIWLSLFLLPIVIVFGNPRKKRSVRKKSKIKEKKNYIGYRKIERFFEPLEDIGIQAGFIAYSLLFAYFTIKDLQNMFCFSSDTFMAFFFFLIFFTNYILNQICYIFVIIVAISDYTYVVSNGGKSIRMYSRYLDLPILYLIISGLITYAIEHRFFLAIFSALQPKYVKPKPKPRRVISDPFVKKILSQWL